MVDSFHARLGHAANTLLCASPTSGAAREACTDLLDPGVEEIRVVWVTYTRGPGVCLAQWPSDAPADRRVVAVGDTPEPVGASSVGSRIERVASTDDLTGLGIAIGRLLREWDGRVALCFDSVTALLEYVAFERAYEFLHSLTGRLYAADATAHFHLDPDAHDAREVATVTSLFDARVTIDGTGDAEIRTRSSPD